MSDGCGLPVNPEETPAQPTFTNELDGQEVIGNTPPEGVPQADNDDFQPPVEDPVVTPAASGPREFLADFDTASHILSVGASLDKRPDAVSLDYLTAYSIGPLANGDASGGPRARIWRVRAVNDTVLGTGEILLARTNDAGTDWEDDSVLFAYVGEAAEVDLAFEQAARPVVCLEIAGRVWLYWFDTVDAQFELTDFDDGRNPRLLLDNPADTTDSDVLLFYVRDDSDAVVFRQQRDRYAVRYDTPLTGTTDKFLEEVLKTDDNRLAIIASVRNTTTGQYSLQRRETTLYPFIMEPDPGTLGLQIVSGNLIVAVLTQTQLDEFKLGLTILSGGLVSPLILYTTDIEEYKLGLAIQSGTNNVVVLIRTMFDIDEVKAALAIQSGNLVIVVIQHTLFDVDEAKAGLSIIGGSLGPP